MPISGRLDAVQAQTATSSTNQITQPGADARLNPLGNYNLPVAYQLYLPEDWAKDPIRRAKAGVPADVAFATKPQIALRQIEATLAAGVPHGVVLMDAGYGADTDLRDAVTALGLPYSPGILPNTTVWPQGGGPLPSQEWSGRGREPTRLRRDAEHQPVHVKSLALGLPADTWQTVTRREGSAIDITSRFARVRGRPTHRDTQRDEPRPEEWLLIEWPEKASEPIKYWFSTLPEDISFVEMVNTAKLHWRVEGNTRISSRRAASDTMKAEPGEASTTMQPCASQPTAF